jgi:tRNA G18 (ribose-2'-O)-methylase SpoU
MPFFSVDDPADPRLAPYRGVADPARLAADGLFVVEGRLVVRRMLAESRLQAQSVLVTEPARQALAGAFDPADGPPVYVAPQAVVNGVAGFDMHRGCLALGVRPAAADWPALVDAFPPVARLVLLDAISNADNIGGIFRSAAALGAHAVLLGPGCGDPLYRKAIRTSIGATLVVPFATVTGWTAVADVLHARGFRLLALTPSAGEPIAEEAETIRRQPRLAIFAGAEGDGLGSDALAAADRFLRIPMVPGVDSLNVTVAVGIALHRLTPAQDQAQAQAQDQDQD